MPSGSTATRPEQPGEAGRSRVISMASSASVHSGGRSSFVSPTSKASKASKQIRYGPSSTRWTGTGGPRSRAIVTLCSATGFVSRHPEDSAPAGPGGGDDGRVERHLRGEVLCLLGVVPRGSSFTPRWRRGPAPTR